MPLDFLDQPIVVQPGQLSAQDLVSEVLRDAAKSCENLIDMLPSLLENGLISTVTAQQADRYLTAMAETFRVPLVAQGEQVPATIR